MRLPDNTWRVAAIAISSFVQYNTVWGRMDWLAEDPHVDLDAILPEPGDFRAITDFPRDSKISPVVEQRISRRSARPHGCER